MADIHQYEPLWGSWHVDTLLGEGSFGKVYRVHREEFGKMYYSAVKIITIPQNEGDLRQMKSEGMDDASARSYLYQFVADIIQEIDLLSEFRGNSNIVSFEDHKVIERPDEIGWDILIRMELLTSLTDYVIEHPPSPDEVVKLGIHICKALELCAAHNTIHRDIKPDNIFVSKFGEYKLGDFGIARQIERTMSGLSKKGTYTYMAPEVFKGEEYGASVDIYSLGIVMYRLLNHNRIPFLPDFPAPITPSDRDESLARRMRGEPLPPLKNIPLELNDIILRACVYDKQNRIGKPKELCESLEAIAANMKNMSLVDIGSITDRTIGADTVLMPLASPYEKAGGVESATPVPKFNELGRCAKCGQETDLHGMFCWHCGVKLDVLKTLDGADETVLNPVQKVPSSAKKLRLIPGVIATILVITLILTGALTSWFEMAERASDERDIAAFSNGIMSDTDTQAAGELESTSVLFPLTQDCAKAYQNLINAGFDYTVALKSDGTVVAVGSNEYGQTDISSWRDIVAISAGEGRTVGLKSNGTVVAVGFNRYTQKKTSPWYVNDIVAVSVGGGHTVGLKSNGTVVAVQWNEYGQTNVSSWRDIAAISAGQYHTVGLKVDKTAVAAGSNSLGQTDVSSWSDIVAISAGNFHTVGLKQNGSVVAIGQDTFGQADVSSWRDIVAISAGGVHTVGLKSDGTVVAVGSNEYGQADVSSWFDIVAISAGENHTVGLKSDGTVVAAGLNNYGQTDVSAWSGIEPGNYLAQRNGTSLGRNQAFDTISEHNEISLSALTPVAQYNWGFNKLGAIDASGNTQPYTSSYLAVGNGNYAEYIVDGKYTHLSGRIVAHERMHKDGSAKLIVYADDQAVYSSPAINRNSRVLDFSADISGANRLRIDIVGVSNTSDRWLLMLDLTLSSEVVVGELPKKQDSIPVQRDTIDLSALMPTAQNKWDFNKLGAVDAKGNMRPYTSSYLAVGNGNYAQYYVGGMYYTQLSGRIVAHELMHEFGAARLDVYADGRCVYSSPIVNKNTQIFDFSADISDAHWLRVEVVGTSDTGDRWLLLLDLSLSANGSKLPSPPETTLQTRQYSLTGGDPEMPPGPYTPMTVGELNKLKGSWIHVIDGILDVDGTEAFQFKFDEMQQGELWISRGRLYSDDGIYYYGNYRFLGNGLFQANVREYSSDDDTINVKNPVISVNFNVEWASRNHDIAIFSLDSFENDGVFEIALRGLEAPMAFNQPW